MRLCERSYSADRYTLRPIQFGGSEPAAAGVTSLQSYGSHAGRRRFRAIASPADNARRCVPCQTTFFALLSIRRCAREPTRRDRRRYVARGGVHEGRCDCRRLDQRRCGVGLYRAGLCGWLRACGCRRLRRCDPHDAREILKFLGSMMSNVCRKWFPGKLLWEKGIWMRSSHGMGN